MIAEDPMRQMDVGCWYSNGVSTLAQCVANAAVRCQLSEQEVGTY